MPGRRYGKMKGSVKKVSLGSWAFTFGPHAEEPLSLLETARRAARSGYEGLELSGFSPHASPDEYRSPGKRAELRSQLASEGLAVSGYAADLTTVCPIRPDNRSRYLDHFQRAAELAAELGSPSIRVDTVAAPGSIPDESLPAAMDAVAECWRDASSMAAALGLRVVWEFEPGFLFNKPSEIVELHEKVRHPNFYLLFDTAHAYMTSVVGARHQGPPGTLRRGLRQMLDLCAGRIGAVHLIDSDGSLYNDETSRHMPFGDGEIDFNEIAPALRTLPGVEWITVDLCFCEDRDRWLTPSREFVTALLHGFPPPPAPVRRVLTAR